MSYQRLSMAEKERYARDRQREPALRCPRCEMAIDADDMGAHIRDRCPGAREPHPLSKWVTWGEAVALGVSEATLSRWVKRGLVRRRCEDGKRTAPRRRGKPAKFVYLRRDLTARLAITFAYASKSPIDTAATSGIEREACRQR